jgi:type IV pilus assembly protein PilO
MALEMKAPDLAAFKAIPNQQKAAILVLLLVVIGVVFWFYVESPQQDALASLQGEISKLNKEIKANKDKVANLEELKRVTAELEKQLAKNQESLPPEEEAATLLKQLSDLGTRIGLDFKSWRQAPRAEDSSRLFVRLPVDVEMSGGYHTLALFFDRIGKLPRIINVSRIKMGTGKVELGRVRIQTTFQLTAFATPSAVTVAPAGGADAAKKPK